MKDYIVLSSERSRRRCARATREIDKHSSTERVSEREREYYLYDYRF